MATPDHEVSNRPRWTLAEASRRTGTSRATLLRRIESGKIPGARKDDNGWSIGIEDLLAAGFTPDRAQPPMDVHGHVHEHVQPNVDTARRVAELEHQLALAHAQRAAAEQIAAERERIIEVQSMALRMLEARAPDHPPQQESQVQDSPAPETTQVKVLGRLRKSLRNITSRPA